MGGEEGGEEGVMNRNKILINVFTHTHTILHYTLNKKNYKY